MEGSVLDSGKGSYFYFIVRSSVTWINNVKFNWFLICTCIDNNIVSSAIWKITCTSEFFKDDENCTSPNSEASGNLKSLKTSKFPNCTRNYTNACNELTTGTTVCNELRRNYSKVWTFVTYYIFRANFVFNITKRVEPGNKTETSTWRQSLGYYPFARAVEDTGNGNFYILPVNTDKCNKISQRPPRIVRQCTRVSKTESNLARTSTKIIKSNSVMH
jgi:hypothetical protein